MLTALLIIVLVFGVLLMLVHASHLLDGKGAYPRYVIRNPWMDLFGLVFGVTLAFFAIWCLVN